MMMLSLRYLARYMFCFVVFGCSCRGLVCSDHQRATTATCGQTFASNVCVRVCVTVFVPHHLSRRTAFTGPRPDLL